MDIIYVLIPIAILLVTIAVIIFIWAVKNKQYDNLEKEAHSILFDEDGE